MRRLRTRRQYVAADLDLLPFMGLFVVLVPLMLLSAVFVKVAVVELSFPGDEAAAEAAALPVTVRIGPAAYVLESTDGSREVPRGVDDLAELTRALSEIGARHPGLASVVIVSEPSTRYEEIVTVMDASRDSGLPQVSLAAAMGGAP